MAKILIIETSGSSCSVALSVDGKITYEINDNKEAGMATAQSEHSTILAPYIEEILLKEKNIDAVAVSAGPGSYTGLRIGLSTAKGICYGKSIPLILVDSLRPIVEEIIKTTSLESYSELEVMVDARRMEVYRAKYSSKGKQLTDIEATIITEETFKNYSRKIYLAGSGAKKCEELLSNLEVEWEIIEVTPSASSLGEWVQKKYAEENFADLAYAEPLYIKEWQPYTPPKNEKKD